MAALAACADDGWTGEGAANGEEGLSAYRERMVESRATQPDTWFDEGTKYRIWVTQDSSATPDVETGGENGYVGTETVRTDGTHYIDFRAVEGSAERDFYGFTSGDGTVPAETSVDGAYAITRSDGGDYTDYLRGKLAYPYEGAEQQGGILQMPFRHIMSQVCVEVSKSTEVKGEIEVVSVELMGSRTGEGITSEGTYEVYGNMFTFGKEATRVLSATAGALPDNGTTLGIDTVLIFPTFENDADAETVTEAPLTYLRVKFKDPAEVYPKFYTDNEGNKQIVVAVYNANTNKPLVFRQNHSYTLHVTFITDQQRVVTLVPQVYNWIEKEGTAENGWMTAEDLGQPVTFNGLLWSDRNLGATSGNPTRSVDDWYNSLGYIYQYGRNIPYYPFTVTTQGSNAIINYETPAKDAFQLGRPIYPLINPESWGISLSMSKIQIINNTSYELVWDLDASQSDGYFGYYNNQNDYRLSKLNGYNNDWAENTNTPCPPGWRLPTLSEFMGILPSSSFAGNITFRRFNGNEGENGGWIAMGSNDVEREKEPNFETAFSKSNIKNMTETTTSSEPAYKGYFPYIYREEKDDLKDGSEARGVYVLSMAEGDRTHISNRDGENWLDRSSDGSGSHDFNWGVIYGIKNQGTPRAYRMRWSIKLMTEETPYVDEKDGRLIYKDNPFRGVLVIERFEATATDDFWADDDDSYGASVKSYDWEHPVAVMYLPIGGICDNWSIGKYRGIANIGTEVWYATSETDETNENRKKIVWIKFAGSSCKDSQAISTTDRSQLAAAIFIRPVRDF